MSERKVLNKYYPPDFDPEKLPRLRRGENFSYKVRLMAPFSMRCNTCGEWVHKGKKFNARKEDAHGESYLGIQIYRFYIRCPRCSAEISFKTDPENTDYICETGASRNFEPWRDQAREKEETKKEREEEEENNPMKALENRTEDSKREIQNLDALDEIRTINALKETTNVDEVLKRLEWEKNLDPEAEAENRVVQEVFSERQHFIRRIDEDQETEVKVQFFAKKRPGETLASSAPKQQKNLSIFGLVKKTPKPSEPKEIKEIEKQAPAKSLAALVGYYEDSD